MKLIMKDPNYEFCGTCPRTVPQLLPPVGPVASLAGPSCVSHRVDLLGPLGFPALGSDLLLVTPMELSWQSITESCRGTNSFHAPAA
jgi:hypothetical protein